MKEEYTKAKFYKSFIDIQKASGQGMSGLVKLARPEVAAYLSELIDEGLCIVMDTGVTHGHPESNLFYLPTKGYNVWKENQPMAGLECVRYYLAKLYDPHTAYTEGSFLSEEDFQEGGDFHEYYKDWLGRNQEALDEMLALSNVYPC